jgi:hypothetical protein
MEIVEGEIMKKKKGICKCSFCSGKAEYGKRTAGYSEMTDRGKISRHWVENYQKCLEPKCGREKTWGTSGHTEKDISYHSNEERRVYNL